MAKIRFNTPLKIISVVLAVIIVILVAGGIYCISTKQTPVEAVKTVFTDNNEQLIGKWQSQSKPGLSAYVFYEDGTYDSYISTANFSGRYIIDGHKLRLVNPSTNKEVVYRFSVNEKVLTLTLVEENGSISEEKEVSKYDRVDELNQKSLADLIGELKEDNESTSAESSEE